MHKVAGSNPAGHQHIFRHLSVFLLLLTLMTHIEEVGSYGVMVSTLDFESSNPSSNLGGTYFFSNVENVGEKSYTANCLIPTGSKLSIVGQKNFLSKLYGGK